ncbi:M20/M25/M40 family metallo-hydrolase [Paenarthrobacter sp. NPDC089322]|uniref:M20/M25/M40 family metallo-hydrolase n=1 Tax=Paenarthrobacter sp. NPDC089322 TaxID=3155065 RepID=UPI0034397CD2
MELPARLHQANIEAITAAVDQELGEHLDILARLVAVPGVAWPEYDQQPLEHGTEIVRELLVASGFPGPAIIRPSVNPDVAGSPGVLASRPAAEGSSTVLLYAHHDVQPGGPREAWDREPFSAVVKGERLFGRGVADDKAGIVMHLAAIRALDRVLGPGHGLGLTVFIEGEEESGSPNLAALFNQFGQELRADAAIVADSGSWTVGTPGLTTSLRGLVDGTLHVRVLEHALHSGTFGGPVLDALTALARLMATFHHDDGSVAVEGLVEARASGLAIDEDTFRADAGVPDGVRLAGTGTLASRLWSKPALSFIGLDAQPIATAANALLPEATVKFSPQQALHCHCE